MGMKREYEIYKKLCEKSCRINNETVRQYLGRERHSLETLSLD